LYLAYPDPPALPTIATAVARAYLPQLTQRQLGRLGLKLLT
jgi:phosphatidylglycerol lysyltransferase